MTRVLVVSHDRVGHQMAGPGIRYRELARVLAHHFPVTLAVPDKALLADVPFAVWPYRRDQWDSLAQAASQADVIVACGDTLADFPPLTELETPLVIDGYDPHTLETLALWTAETIDFQNARYSERLAVLRRQCQAGDFFICASERQRDWWLGLLEHERRINPLTYADDPSLRRFVDVVPYGLPSEPPQASGPVLRGVWSGIGADDWIVLWGGGLWEWLDPLTAIRATRRLADQGQTIRLVFPGTRHPNSSVPDMPIRTRTLALSDKLGLTGTHVFFGDWVPHKDWGAVLLEANLGLSLHPDTVEARLAYRSRVLDYVWADLPMVVTRGDAAAEMVTHYDLGLVVDFGDDEAVAEGIASLLGAPGGRRSRSAAFEAARRDLTWERAADPLVAFCRNPHRAADRQNGATWTVDESIRELPNRLTHEKNETDHLHRRVNDKGRGSGRWADGARERWRSLATNRYLKPWLERLHTERFYRQLVQEVGQASNHAFVDRGYWRILRRAPDAAGFRHHVDLIAESRLTRRGFVAGLVGSAEFRNRRRHRYGVAETLHLTRCQLIRQLPPADDVLDLGGAALNSIQGALLVMGYPHRFRSLTIIDLPPTERLGEYVFSDGEKVGDWLQSEMGPIRYLHTPMTDLSAIASNSMDLVFSGQSIEHVSKEEGQKVFHQVYRVLRPGGHFCLDTVNAAVARIQSPDVFLHPEHQVEYYVEELVAALRDVGFMIQRTIGLCPMPRTVESGLFDEQELVANGCLSDRAEISYLFYVWCIKPGEE